MHYRTPRIGFLDTAEDFIARHPHVERPAGAAFDTGELPLGDGPVIVVPEVP
jgi:hypothetical protein